MVYDYSEKKVCMGNLTKSQADAFEKMPQELKNSFKGNLVNLAKVLGTHHSVLSSWMNTNPKEAYQYRTTGMYVEFPIMNENVEAASEEQIELILDNLYEQKKDKNIERQTNR